MGAARNEVESFLNMLLQPERFRDYGPNGLQVEGRAGVRKVVSGVTASLALIDAAIARGADTLLVRCRGSDARRAAGDTRTFLACGHHATERYGAPAVAAHLAEAFGLEHEFIEIENPA